MSGVTVLEGDVVAHSAPTLGSGNLRDVVRLPEGEDLNEWLAVNIMDVFNQVRMLYGTVVSFCTNESCPQMTAGSKHEYYWKESDRVYDSVILSLFHFTIIKRIFMMRRPFPRNFHQVCESIMKRLFRVYAHVYSSHASKIREQNSTPHLNTSFKQFILFALQFKLIPQTELEPLRPIIDDLIGS
uniref:MOB kinase activator-like 1 n=1 Tax=Heterorhabditis bacteriophora TaxID=37862 RepID=A0A1I7XD91_HETBA